MQILIKKILNKEKVSQGGKNYISCSILTVNTKGEDTWINGFGNDTTKSWVVGQTVDLEVYQDEYNGKISYKFRDVPERNIFAEFDKLNKKIDMLIGTKELAKELGGEVVEEPKQISVGDLPF